MILRALYDMLQDAPNFRGRKRLMNRLLPHLDCARSAYGPLLTVRANDTTFRASYFGHYGSELARLIEGLPQTGMFLDFGANTGVFSLVAAKHLTRGRVYSLEPNPLVFRDLINNIELNRARNVTAFNFAVGDTTELKPLVYSTDHTGKGHIAGDDSGDEFCYVTLLDVTQFALLLAPEMAGVACLCKIDTEGAELSILRALDRADILSRVSTFYIEIDDANLARFGATSAEVYDLLRARGYVPATDRRDAKHYDEIFIRIAE
jgi:FkbM family methyltransferase